MGKRSQHLGVKRDGLTYLCTPRKATQRCFPHGHEICDSAGRQRDLVTALRRACNTRDGPIQALDDLTDLTAVIMKRDGFDKILIDILWDTPTPYLDVLSRDELQHYIALDRIASVGNTDPISLAAEHWVGFYQRSPFQFYFDH